MKYLAISAFALLLAGCSNMASLDYDYGPTFAPVGVSVSVSENMSATHFQSGTERAPNIDDQSFVDDSAPYANDEPQYDADQSAITDDQSTTDTAPSDIREVTFVDSSCKVQDGDIVINTSEHELLFVTSCGHGEIYPVAVGRDGKKWSGVTTVERKSEWPAWYPPEEMRAREAANGHFLPTMMPGGKDNPLGARAIYLAGTEYRIHGTNKPESIGTDASSGCIRMHNEDVVDLYDKVKVGAHVYVIGPQGKLSNQITQN